MASSKHFLNVILLIILVLSTTSCIRAVSGYPTISATEPEIHERTFEGEYLDSVSFQTRIDIVNWASGVKIILFMLGYAALMIGVIVLRRKSLKVWYRVIIPALFVIFIFCENLNFHNVERFFMASLNVSKQPVTVVIKRRTTSNFFPIPVRYQIEKTSTVIWTPFANLLVDQMIKQSVSR